MTRIYFKTGNAELHCIDAANADHKTAIWSVGSHLVRGRDADKARGPLLAVIDGDKRADPVKNTRVMLKFEHHSPSFNDEPPRGAA